MIHKENNLEFEAIHLNHISNNKNSLQLFM